MAINKKVMEVFVDFTSGIIPLVGPFASGLKSAKKIINIRVKSIRSADDILNGIENYIEVIYVWKEATRGYIKIIEEWREVITT